MKYKQVNIYTRIYVYIYVYIYTYMYIIYIETTGLEQAIGTSSWGLSVLQRVAACCSVLQRVAACCCVVGHHHRHTPVTTYLLGGK